MSNYNPPDPLPPPLTIFNNVNWEIPDIISGGGGGGAGPQGIAGPQGLQGATGIGSQGFQGPTTISQFSETILAGATATLNIPISNAINTIQVFVSIGFTGGIIYSPQIHLTDTPDVPQGLNMGMNQTSRLAPVNTLCYSMANPVSRISSTFFITNRQGGGGDTNGIRGPPPLYITMSLFGGFPIGTIVGVYTT